MKRDVVRIEADRCNGCGLCVKACAEGAITMLDGKAHVVSETHCDGLGACLGHCPAGAITIEHREAPAFDPSAAERHHKASSSAAHGGECPGSAWRQLAPGMPRSADAQPSVSALANWPVQLRLLNPDAPYLRGSHLLVAADCVPFALADFHSRLLAGRVVAVGCPKLDDGSAHVDKLAEIFASAGVRAVTVAHMEVPCCAGIVWAVQEALQRSGRDDIPLNDVTIGIGGEVRRENNQSTF